MKQVEVNIKMVLKGTENKPRYVEFNTSEDSKLKLWNAKRFCKEFNFEMKMLQAIIDEEQGK